ncbi:MAG: hypothetical protein FK731_05390 [Asgard group archaeon]|nr:hypothetical protein [Asgard group archaeon]
MTEYVIKSYEKGFEIDQEKIGKDVAKSFIQPHQTAAERLKEIYTQEGFDPETRLYAFKDNEMIGFLTARILEETEDGVKKANLTPPTVLKKHYEKVSELLFNKAIEVLKTKDVKKVLSTFGVRTVQDSNVAKKWGYNIISTNYFFSINIKKIDSNVSYDKVIDFDKEKHFNDVIEIIKEEFGVDEERAKNILEQFEGIPDNIYKRQFVLVDNGKVNAYSIMVQNFLVPSITRIFAIQAKNEDYMKQMLRKISEVCKEKHINMLQIAYTDENDIKSDKYKPIKFDLLGTICQCELDL